MRGYIGFILFCFGALALDGNQIAGAGMVVIGLGLLLGQAGKDGAVRWR